MYKKNLLIIGFTFLFITTVAQNEFPLFQVPEGKSTRSKSNVTPNVFKLYDGTVAILAKDQLYRYDANYKLMYQANLANLFQYQAQEANLLVAADQNVLYILEVAESSKGKVSIINVDAKGIGHQQFYDLDITPFIPGYLIYVSNGALCVLAHDTDKSKKMIVYTHHIITPGATKQVTTIVGLPSDEYEFDKIMSGEPGQYDWSYLGTDGDNVILIKAYFRYEKESKGNKFVGGLVEVDGNGHAHDQKTFTFAPKSSGQDRIFVEPTLIYDNSDNSVLLAGFMELERDKLNGLYLIKYDYTTGSVIYNKEFTFDELMKRELKKNFPVHYEIPSNTLKYYPFKIRNDDFFVDKTNKFLYLRIITDYSSSKNTFFEVAFDKYGYHIKTHLVTYKQLPNSFSEYCRTPEEYQDVWEDKNKPHVTAAGQSPWDYIDKKAAPGKTDNWAPVSTPNSNSLIRYFAEDGKFFATILE